MKNLWKLWKIDLLRPVFYQSVTKSSVALAALLLWNRFVNAGGTRSAVRDGAFIAAVILLAAAWVNYLRLDGVTIHHLLEERKKKPRKRRIHWVKDIVDFTDEAVISWDDFTEEERLLCGLCSSLLSGLLFLIPSLVSTALFYLRAA